MGVSGHGEKSLSRKTQKNDNDIAVRKIINKQYAEEQQGNAHRWLCSAVSV